MRENVLFDHHSTASGSLNSPVPARHAGVDQTARGPRTPRIDSRRLMAGENELVIEHAGQEYRLRLTRNDKLILTK
jgi:hemin uptake protein HemP